MPKRNRATGHPKGAQPGSRNALVNGMRTAAMVENRRVFWVLMQAAAQAMRESQIGERRRNGPPEA